MAPPKQFGSLIRVWEALFGIRFDFISNAAMKLEIGYGEAEKRNGGGVVITRSYIKAGFQLAWVF